MVSLWFLFESEPGWGCPKGNTPTFCSQPKWGSSRKKRQEEQHGHLLKPTTTIPLEISTKLPVPFFGIQKVGTPNKKSATCAGQGTSAGQGGAAGGGESQLLWLVLAFFGVLGLGCLTCVSIFPGFLGCLGILGGFVGVDKNPVRTFLEGLLLNHSTAGRRLSTFLLGFRGRACRRRRRGQASPMPHARRADRRELMGVFGWAWVR